MSEDDRVEMEREKLTLTITGEMSAEVTDCQIHREDGTIETIPWSMEIDEGQVRFVPRGPVMLGPKDVLQWLWKEYE